MNLQMGKLPDGDLAIVCDTKLPHDVKRVEYYRDQKLFMIVYDDETHEGDLVHYELPDDWATKVEAKGNLIIVETDPQNGQQKGYYTPLIQLGA